MKIKTARFSQMTFLLLWVAAHALSWVVLLLLSDSGYLDDIDDLAVGFLFGAVIGGGITIVQKFLLEQNYGIRIKGWLPLSLGAWVVGGWCMVGLSEFFRFGFATPVAVYLALLVAPAGLIQAYLLRHYVRQSWVWFLAMIVSAIVFSSVVEADRYDETVLLFGLAGLAQGAVTGLAILWMFATEQGEKPKHGMDTV